jgi:hypothetical protein
MLRTDVPQSLFRGLRLRDTSITKKYFGCASFYGTKPLIVTNIPHNFSDLDYIYIKLFLMAKFPKWVSTHTGLLSILKMGFRGKLFGSGNWAGCSAGPGDKQSDKLCVPLAAGVGKKCQPGFFRRQSCPVRARRKHRIVSISDRNNSSA